MKQKIIFLDFDGVLNNPYYLTRAYKTQGLGKYQKQFDPLKVKILQKICQLTNAKVVATSSWRGEESCSFLLKQGIPIIGMVPDTNGGRGEDIDIWLQRQDDDFDYLILDDETSDYSPEQMKHLICTKETYSSDLAVKYDCVEGLQEKHIGWAISMLCSSTLGKFLTKEG